MITSHDADARTEQAVFEPQNVIKGIQWANQQPLVQHCWSRDCFLQTTKLHSYLVFAGIEVATRLQTAALSLSLSIEPFSLIWMQDMWYWGLGTQINLIGFTPCPEGVTLLRHNH